jgi:DNA-binding XRE family transcriptional regulator
LRGPRLGCKETRTLALFWRASLVKKLIPINRLGDALRAARQAAKTTQQQLADDADIPRLAVIRAEAGTGLLRPFESLLVPLKCEIQGRNLPRGTDIGTRFKELRIARGISTNDSCYRKRGTGPPGRSRGARADPWRGLNSQTYRRPGVVLDEHSRHVVG